MAALCAVTLAAFASVAAAETVRTNQIGGSRVLLACAGPDVQSDFSDQRILACDRALHEPLTPDQRMAVLVNRGAIRARRQEHSLALADFDAAQALQPDNPTVMLNRGMVLVQLRQSGPAVAALTQALSYGAPNAYLAYYYRGVARERLGDARGAYEDYSTALEIQPNWAPAEQEMARFARGRRQDLASQVNDAPRPR